MGAKTIVFGDAAPPCVYHRRPLGLRSYAVLPMVGVRIAAAGPSKDRYFQLAQRSDDVIPHSFGICNRLVRVANIEPIVNAMAQVFCEVTINILVYDDLSLVGMNYNIILGGCTKYT